MLLNTLSFVQTAQSLNISRTTLRHWLGETRTLPKDAFSIMCDSNPKLKVYRRHILSELPENWGQIKGGKNKASLTQDLNKVLIRVRAMKEEKRKSSALVSKRKIRPINSILAEIHNEGADPLIVLAMGLITDGSLTISGNSYRICYYTKDQVLRRLSKALLYNLSLFVPSEAKTKKKVYAIRVTDADLAKKLLALSPSYKTSPYHGQTKASYLAEPQPSIKFLGGCNQKTLQWGIRFAFSADGSISISKNNVIELNLSCYNPTLCHEWLKVLKKFEISGHIGNDRTGWAGVKGIRIYDANSIRNFAKIGGFINGVRISGKSKRYKGLAKNKLLNQAIRARSSAWSAAFD